MTTPDFPHDMDPKTHNSSPELESELPGSGSGPGDSVLRDSVLGIDEQLSPEELALRRLLHDAVHDIEPRQDALQHLRRAVPARRTHRRQLLVGTAAACLLALVAVPAVLHVAGTADTENPNPANASSAHDTGGTNGRTDNGGSESALPAGGGKKDSDGRPRKPSGTSPSTASSSTANPSDTLAATAPLCTSADLGSAQAVTGSAGSSGSVSGYFRISNISAGPCTVNADSATVTATAQGSADASRISVVDHTAGDGTGLPDTVANPLILTAGQSYQVEFTWVPASGTTGCEATSTPTPTPTPSASDTSSSGSTTDGTTTASTVSSTSDDSGSIVLTHTPEAGGPAVSTTVSDACAGTVYKTGALLVT
jgi:hypothetical protein